ncbi:MAG: response regulator [Desulfobulbaceae bacterium]|nr:response regulator [Desulfobulbaceae bacterium]
MVMIDVALEIVRSAVVGVIIYSLWRAGSKEGGHGIRGWRWIFYGFVLVFFATLIDITDNFPGLDRFVVVGDTPVQAFLEKVVGYLGGFTLLAVGFWQLLPGIARLKQAEREVREARDNLEQQVRQRTIALVHAKEAAESACVVKNQFLANMSHELRTPLNGIIGFADILGDMDIGEEPRKFVRIIKSSTDGLLKIIDDVLDFSKLEGGRLTFHEADFSLRQVLDAVREKMRPAAAGKALDLQWEIAGDVPDALRGDGARLAQVVTNLLDNAVKFTEQGVVGLRVGLAGAEAGDGGVQLEFAVHDTGIGVVPDKRETIFESFTQADGSHVRKHEGAGLGLTIASRLVRMMGGTLWLAENAEAGRGSVFRFTARLACAVTEVEGQPEAGMFATVGRRILLAEDEPVNQMLTMRILKWQGWEADCVDTGRKVLAALAKQSYDLILMDVQMPELDGLETTAAIRAAEKVNGGHVKIIALTAHAMPGDREECLEAGMDGYVEKPFRAEELVAVIERHLA